MGSLRPKNSQIKAKHGQNNAKATQEFLRSLHAWRTNGGDEFLNRLARNTSGQNLGVGNKSKNNRGKR